MMPAGPLMKEHRLIERMIDLLRRESARIREVREIDAGLIDTAVDFIRTYADRTHHGKEEDILFRDLSSKDLAPEHQRVMEELVNEHVQARATVGELVEAKGKSLSGDQSALITVLEKLDALVDLYPAHIEKEDKHFFLPVMEVLSDAEQTRMLEEMWEFDQKMIHEKYHAVVEELEGRAAV